MAPIIALAIQYLPTLLGLIAGPKAADVVNTITSVAKQVFGTDTPTADQTSNAALVNEFVEKLKQETEQFRISVEDTQDARKQTVELAQAGSPIAYGAVAISILIVLSFMLDLVLLMTMKINFNDVTGQVMLILTGTLSAAFTQVVNYWLGSSASSAAKDSFLRTMVPPATPAKAKAK